MTVDKYWDDTFNRLSIQEKQIIDDKLMNVVRFYPYDSEPLQKELAGLYSYNRIGSGNRIIFAICYECRKGGFTKVNNCKDCNDMGNDVVKLFVAGPHYVYESLKIERRKRIRFRQ